MSLIGVPPSGAAMPGTPPMYCALKVLRTKTLSPSAGPALRVGGLPDSAPGVVDPARQHSKKRQWDLWVAFEDPPEMPALDPECGGRLDRTDGRRTWEFVEERHLAEDIAGTERG